MNSRQPIANSQPSRMVLRSRAERRAYRLGYVEGYSPKDHEGNPYKRRTFHRLRNAWMAGWIDGSEKWIADRAAGEITENGGELPKITTEGVAPERQGGADGGLL